MVADEHDSLRGLRERHEQIERIGPRGLVDYDRIIGPRSLDIGQLGARCLLACSGEYGRIGDERALQGLWIALDRIKKREDGLVRRVARRPPVLIKLISGLREDREDVRARARDSLAAAIGRDQLKEQTA